MYFHFENEGDGTRCKSERPDKWMFFYFGLVLLTQTIIIFYAYLRSRHLRQRPGHVVLGYIACCFFGSLRWIAHPFYEVEDGIWCDVLGSVGILLEQLTQFYEASNTLALIRFYKTRERNLPLRNMWKYHFWSIVAASFTTLILLVLLEPGRDFFCLCAIQCKKEHETTAMIFDGALYIALTAFYVYVCCSIWFSQPEPAPPLVQPIERDNVDPEQKEGSSVTVADAAEKFRSVLKLYLLCITATLTLLTALKFYADWQVKNSDDEKNKNNQDNSDNSDSIKGLLIAHDSIDLSQPILLMLVIFDETPIRKALNKLWKNFKSWIGKFAELCKTKIGLVIILVICVIIIVVALFLVLFL